MSLMDSLLLDPFPLDVWVAPRTDGVLGSGTEDNPYDGNFRTITAIPVTSITAGGVGNLTATVTTGVNHGFQSRQFVQISGVVSGANGLDGSYYNGTFQIAVTGLNTFTYVMWAAPPDNSATPGASGIACQADPCFFDGAMRSLPKQVNTIVIATGSTVTAWIANHGFGVGDIVLISGATGVDAQHYNGVCTVTAVDPSYYTGWFQYTAHGAPGGSATGNVYCQFHQFDAAARVVTQAPPVAVRLGPGTFQTKGFAPFAFGGWLSQSGMKIKGSSMGVSVLKLIGAVIDIVPGVYQAETAAIGNLYDQYTDSFEACDLTIDCNIDGQSAVNKNVTCSAIQIVGKHTRYRRIRAINFGTQSNAKECFPVAAAFAHPFLVAAGLEAFDCVIQDCILEQPGLNNQQTTTLIGFQATEGSFMAYHRACVIRTCFIDGEYRQNPVPVSMITFDSLSGTATVTTRMAHLRNNGDYVRMSGALVNGSIDNSFNGSYPITYLSPTSFSYSPNPAPATNPVGDIWLGRFSSQHVQIASIAYPPAGSGPYIYAVYTQAPHFLVPQQTVVLNQVGNAHFNVVATVTDLIDPSSTLVNPKCFRITLNFKEMPGSVFSAYIGVDSQGPSAGAGRAAVVEGNRVANTRVGGPYGDTDSTREMLVRNNYYRAVVGGPYQNLGQRPSTNPPFPLGTPTQDPLAYALVGSTYVATATTPAGSPHGFNPGDAVYVSGATGQVHNDLLNGTFTITSVTSNSFSFNLLGNPNPPNNTGSSSTGAYSRIWQVDWEAIENNIIELIPTPTNFGAPFGINFYPAWTLPSPFSYPQAVIRRNSIRNVDGTLDVSGAPGAILVESCGALIQEENIIDLKLTNWAQNFFTACGATQFFANQSSAGALIQGYDLDRTASVTELSTNVEDAALLAF